MIRFRFISVRLKIYNLRNIGAREYVMVTPDTDRKPHVDKKVVQINETDVSVLHSAQNR